jgi:hypothetical protein
MSRRQALSMTGGAAAAGSDVVYALDEHGGVYALRI